MDQFLQETLANPIWWFTSIFVGLVVSIIANRLTDPISSFLGRFVQSIRERNEAYNSQIEAEVTGIQDDTNAILLLHLQRNYYLIKQAIGVIIGLSLVTLAITDLYKLISILASIAGAASLLTGKTYDSLTSAYSPEYVTSLAIPSFILLCLGSIFFTYGLNNSSKLSQANKIIAIIEQRRDS
jgi:hypothetical protein